MDMLKIKQNSEYAQMEAMRSQLHEKIVDDHNAKRRKLAQDYSEMLNNQMASNKYERAQLKQASRNGNYEDIVEQMERSQHRTSENFKRQQIMPIGSMANKNLLMQQTAMDF